MVITKESRVARQESITQFTGNDVSAVAFGLQCDKTFVRGAIPVPSGYSSTRDFIEDTHGTPSDKKTVTEEFNPSGLSAKAWYDSRLTRMIQLLPKIPNEEPA